MIKESTPLAPPETIPESFRFETEIDYRGESLVLEVTETADGQGIATVMDYDIWLDWHDVLNDPATARLHMFLAYAGDVPEAEKLRRMEKMAVALGAYESVMTPTVLDSLTAGQAVDLVRSGQLPRPQAIALDTSRPGLIKLIEHFDPSATEAPVGEYLAPWQALADLAISGELVKAWKSLKAPLKV